MQLIGRRSSVFTRVPLYLAERLRVPFDFVPIPDMTALDPRAYGSNPALKLPILRVGSTSIFGAQNICRVIAEHAAGNPAPRIVWPEQLVDPVSRNAQELVWHAMAAQVQLVMGTVLAKLRADNVFFVKARTGLEGSLQWLDDHLADALAELPERDFSLFEIATLCLVEHLAFRPTVPMAAYARLRAFADTFATDPAAQRTAYRFDA
jgi:glutathione S-transferase